MISMHSVYVAAANTDGPVKKVCNNWMFTYYNHFTILPLLQTNYKKYIGTSVHLETCNFVLVVALVLFCVLLLLLLLCVCIIFFDFDGRAHW